MSEEPGGGPEGEGAPSRQPQLPPRRLDPDRAAASARRGRRPRSSPTIDTRPYQRLIGFFGLLLVIVVSIAFLTSHRSGTAGVPPGQHVDRFAAPLATSNLSGAANLHPTCSPARHDPRALNVCLLVARKPLVLGFFVTNSSSCERIVGALQRVAGEFSPGEVAFAAVAVHGSHSAAAAAVRTHRWTIPVAYDVDGRVGAAYGIEVCPIVELIDRGGVVARRLIGDHWDSSSALAAQVRAMLGGAG